MRADKRLVARWDDGQMQQALVMMSGADSSGPCQRPFHLVMSSSKSPARTAALNTLMSGRRAFAANRSLDRHGYLHNTTLAFQLATLICYRHSLVYV